MKSKKELRDKEKRDKEKENKGEKERKRRYKVHDSIFKEELEDKEEFKDFLKDFTGYELEEKDIEQSNPEYRTAIGFNGKCIDILYKVVGEETYIVVEHQSTIDYAMSERITEYCMAIIESRKKYMKLSKEREAPVIIPYVLNTNKRKWNATRTIKQKEDNKYRFPVLTYPKYNVIDIHDYTIEELLNKGTGVSFVMAIEKAKTKEQLEELMTKLEEKELNERQKRALYLVIINSEELLSYIPKKEQMKAKEIMEKIMKGEEEDMEQLDFTKTVIRVMKEKDEKMKEKDEKMKEKDEKMKEKDEKMKEKDEIIKQKEAIIKENTEEKEKSIIQLIKKMVKNKIKDEDIMDYLNIDQKQLKKYKLQIT